MPSPEILSLTGASIEPMIAELARLRIAVFRAWPYLYQGDERYEREYLRAFACAPHAVLVVARDGRTIVGAATASPMTGQDAEVRSPFAQRNIPIDDLFYFGESVLLSEYRGRGVGHAFFDAREAHARACGADRTTFCAVVRPSDHPLRPADNRPLDGFWRKRGYAPVKGLTTSFEWKDIDRAESDPHPMQFWMRGLR
ncbi:GNAT family N-acetyltransferase [Sphingosinithalassobacter sp. CS137]|uniref:GNAT family N-acetyltransferase n=1 Tax=Sphingosinithalassobacter sp. CS137 TaxID=2762748 RepID=UPI00165D4E16|nr:GNAT family N-acetyltransferase [Sphingosinithalassobacter sp. CS137]